MRIRLVATHLALWVLFFCGGLYSGYRLWYTPPSPLMAPQQLLVEKATDGDTLRVRMQGKLVSVRLIGVNTPETVDPRKEKQCGGERAKEETKKLEGKTLRFEFVEPDWPPVKRDRYNRPLVYVYLPDGKLFNKELILNGYAHEYTYGGKYKYRTEFKAAQTDARENNRGIWQTESCAAQSARPGR